MLKDIQKMRPGARLKMYIQQSGYTMKQFASMVGMSRETLHRKLNEVTFDANLAHSAADILQLDVGDILGFGLVELNEPGEKYEVRESPEHVAAIENRMLKERVAQLERLLEEQTAIARDLLGMMKILTEKK